MSAPEIAARLARKLKWEDLDAKAIGSLLDIARREDLEGFGLASPPAQGGDITSDILQQSRTLARASLRAREKLTVCGLNLVPLVLATYGQDAVFQPATVDGQDCCDGDLLGTIEGPTSQILPAERVLLNFLQRLSGVSTLTRQYVQTLGDSSTRLLDTRKTTPGFRVLEKYAVACGGGFNHRIGLFDRVMLKDNHLAAEAAVAGDALYQLVHSARQRRPGMVIQLEVDSIDQIPPALEAGLDVILLDNFSIPNLEKAVSLVGDRAATEASGGINLQSLPSLAHLGLDFISTGATIHQAVWKDIGLDWE
jgi:nicotinate-nucleotide pyrophosphorylase (carboxylating)